MRRALLVLIGVALLSGALYVASEQGFARSLPQLLWLLDRFPPDCGHRPGQWAGFVQESLPASCTADLVEGPRSSLLMRQLVADARRSLSVRESAVAQLIRRRADPAGYVDALLAGTDTAPDLRRALLRASRARERESEWSDLAAKVAVHGLYDEGLLRRWADGDREVGGDLLGMTELADAATRADLLPRMLAGLGLRLADLEEGAARHARGQSPLGVMAQWRELYWREDCSDGCFGLTRRLVDRETSRREPPEVHAVLDAVWPDSGRAAEHLAAEIAAISVWIQADEPELRLERAVLQPAGGVVGGLHSVLREGAGYPAATAFLALELGKAADVDVELRWDDGLLVSVGPRNFRLGACGGAMPDAGGGVVLDESQVGALVLVETAGDSLRSGRLESATTQLGAAVRAWPNGAPMRRALAVYSVLRGGIAGPPERSFLPELRVVPSTPRRRGSTPPPLLDARLSARAAAEGSRRAAESASDDNIDRIIAAWWAVRSDRQDTARELLTGPLAGYAELIRSELLRGLGEPGPPPTHSLRPCEPLGLWPELSGPASE